MLLYFTGTGNSRYVAQRLAALTGEKDIVDVSRYLRSGESARLNSERPYVVVCPTYAWRIPRVLEAFLLRSEFSGNQRIYFVMTCGSGIGGALRSLQALCAQKGLTCGGVARIVMPENYVAMFPVPDEEKAKKIVGKAEPSIVAAAACIAAGQQLPGGNGGVLGMLLSGPINNGFYRFCARDKRFRTTERCVGCGACAQVCPLGNVRLEGGKPVWGGNCTHCMACLCLCPSAAIEYGTKSVGKPRYRCPQAD